MRRVWVGLSVLSCALLATTGCERKAIPPRLDVVAKVASPSSAPTDLAPATAEPKTPPALWRTGGTQVFSEDFSNADLSAHWTTEKSDWRVVNGAVHSSKAKNAGLWLKAELPEHARIEFTARSEPPTDGRPFSGDLKCEVFAKTPSHEAGYIVMNGGWSNRLDVIARQDEHAKNRKERTANTVAPSTAYRWSIFQYEGVVYWYRDGELQMTYPDSAPIGGRYFGFNNWEAEVYFDDLAIFDVGAK